MALISVGLLSAANGFAQATNHATIVSKSAPAYSGGNASGDFTSSLPAQQDVHLVVGRSIFVNTKHRLVRVYITNPLILDSYTATPNQVVVTAKATGTSSVIVWDEAGEVQAFLITSDIDVATLRESMKSALPNENVQVNSSEGHIVLTGTTGTGNISDAAMKLAASYSKDVSNAMVINSSTVKQVKLKVRIVEVDRSKLNQFAFNFFSAGGNNLAQTTTGTNPSTVSVTQGGSTGGKNVQITNPLNFLFYSSKLNVGATLQDLQTMNLLQILAEPEIVTMSGQKGSFLAGGEFPFPVVQGSSAGATSISIQFRPYGVKLDFTPVVNIDGTVDLKVAPEVSSLDYTNAVSINGYTIPALSTRHAETQVVLRSGQSFCISGLLDKQTTDSMAHTPGVSSIPIIGALFKSKSLNHSQSELYVIVTPTVVDPLTDNLIPEDPKRGGPMLDVTKFDKDFGEQKKKN